MIVSIKCLACDHVAEVSIEEPTAHPIDDGIFKCHECGARMVYGELAPRIVVEPHVTKNNQKLLRVRFQNQKTLEEVFVCDLDPQFAASLCKNILSLVLP